MAPIHPPRGVVANPGATRRRALVVPALIGRALIAPALAVVLLGGAAAAEIVAPATPTIAPPTAAAPRVAAPTANPTLRIRAGEHTGFSRLVIDLPPGAEPEVAREGGTVRVTLTGARLAPPGNRPSRARAIVADGDGVTITLATGVRLRQVALAGRLVLDLLDAAPARPDVPPAPAVLAPGATARQSPPPKAAPLAPPSLARPALGATSATPPASTVTAPLLPVAAMPLPAGSPPPAPPLPPGVPDGAAAGPLRIAAVPLADDATLTSVMAGPAVLLPFAPTTAAAALRRGDEALLVFDEPRPIDLAALQTMPALAGAQVQLLPAATVLRLPLDPARSVRLAAVPGGWRFSVVPAAPPGAGILASVASGALHLAVANPGRVVSVTDPQTGGLLLVGTLHATAAPDQVLGVATARRTPEFNLLTTWQGVAVEPLADAVELRPERAGFVVQSGQPGRKLFLAPDELAVAPALASSFSRRFDLPDLPVPALLQRLDAATADDAAAAPLHRAPARLAAAQAMLALGMGAEAEALVRLAIAEDARLSSDPQAMAIAAAAAILAGHADAARGIDDAALSAPGQPGGDETMLWRVLRLTEDTPRQVASPTGPLPPELARSLAVRLPLLLSYPAPLRRHLLARAVEALALGGQAATALATTVALPDDRGLDLVRAELAAAAGQNADALTRFDALTRGDDRDLRDRAAIAAVELRLATHAIDPSQAADALDRLTNAWRGDGRELALRLRVAELRAQAGQFRASLALLREAAAPALATNWPDSAALIRSREEATFAAAMERDARSPLTPLDLVALAEENGDLLPSGEPGQQLAQRLADRLIALDLPDRAAPALRKLLDGTASGPVRAGIGEKLAELQLDLGRPQEALVALSASTSSNLPTALEERRTESFARATAERGNLPAALGALAAVESRSGQELRAHLLEVAARWPEAEAALSDWVARSVPPTGPLDVDQSALLLRLAAAAAQTGDADALERLRLQDLPRLPPGHAADELNLLTQQPIRDVADLPRAAREATLTHSVLR